jgi:arylsulfatase A-like enzyme
MAETRRAFLQSGAAAALTPYLGGAAAAAAADRAHPNVVLVIIDTLRADYVSAYGGRAHTPSIDALAARGVRYTRFYPEAMATVPARRSMLTGRRVWPFRGWHRYPSLRNTPGWQPIDNPATTFTSALRRAGYWTGYVTDNPFLGFSRFYEPFRESFDRFASIGGILGRTAPVNAVTRAELNHWLVPELRLPKVEERERRYLAAGGYADDESRSWAARVFSRAAQFLDGAATRQPFALVVDTFQPHEPWTPPLGYIDLYDNGHRGPEPSTLRYGRTAEWLSDRRAGPVLSRVRDLYSAEVTMTDHWLGVFLEHLRSLGLEQNTVIALVSDHGILLGEHGWTGKIASILHPPLTHVPFVLVDPRRRRRGVTSDRLAQTHDIGPTLLSLAGVKAPRGMNGRDLLAGGARKMAYGGYANWHYARTDDIAFVSENRGRGRRLYDLERDPGERKNTARRHPKLIDHLYGAVVRRAGGRPPIYRR